jgi:DNA-directed RNA polymerase I and III subunit RPAC1
MFRPLGIDNAWDLVAFKEEFEIRINRSDEDVIEFDLIGKVASIQSSFFLPIDLMLSLPHLTIGCDPAIANALRRILIAEIPTIAIEHVFMINNTSIIQASSESLF